VAVIPQIHRENKVFKRGSSATEFDNVFLLNSCSFSSPVIPPLTVVPLLCHVMEKVDDRMSKSRVEVSHFLRNFLFCTD